MGNQRVDKEWFHQAINDRGASVRKLAKHMNLDPSAVSRMLSGQRKMQMDEATEIANFLDVSVNEVLKHAGAAIDLEGKPTRIILAATINEKGQIAKLPEPKYLPQPIIDRAHAAITVGGKDKIIAAQVRASTGPLAMLDDAVMLFRATETVEPEAIGVLSVCRDDSGQQVLTKIERARKTGEARVICLNGEGKEITLQTATPILAIIP